MTTGNRWRPAYVALGSNLDDPDARIVEAFGHLCRLPGCRLIAQSRCWRSTPLGPVEQPPFVNAVAGLLTVLSPADLLGSLQDIEATMGRARPIVRWGPRRIDLDLLLLGSEQLVGPGLTLPHPGLPVRDFVLYPLADIAPELWVPGLGRVRHLAAGVDNRGLVALGG
ncbi:MAG: 2-amino-4-hydroxy-6-hydroxymethyldihydropteridine diphosphokinase [Steroidobacteraceae bacterium]